MVTDLVGVLGIDVDDVEPARHQLGQPAKL